MEEVQEEGKKNNEEAQKKENAQEKEDAQENEDAQQPQENPEHRNNHQQNGLVENPIERLLDNDVEDEIFLKKDCICPICSKYCSEDYMYAVTFPGRLIMTFYSFQSLFFLYNFIINYIFLLPGILFYSDNVFYLVCVFTIFIIFASFCSNILIIPTYELVLFPFLRYKNTLAHLESLKIVINIIHNNNNKNDKIEFKKSYFLLDISLIVIEIAYLAGFILGFKSQTIWFKDVVRLIIYITIYIDYLVIVFGYAIISVDLKIHIISKMKEESQGRFFITNICLFMDKYINDFFNNKPALPKINLACYVINPLLDKSYYNIDEANDIDNQDNWFNFFRKLLTCELKCSKTCFETIKSCSCFCCCSECCSNCCKSCCGCCFPDGSLKNFFHTLKNMIRAIIFIIAYALSLYIISNQDTPFGVAFIITLVFLITYCLSSFLNFPYIIRNKDVFFLCSTKKKFKGDYNLEHPIIIAFIRFVSFLIIVVVALGIIIVYAIWDESSHWLDLKKQHFEPNPVKKDSTKLLPNICYSSIHNLYIQLFLPFINDAYYYDDNPTISPDFYSSFQIPEYRQLFYDDELYNININGDLITSKNKNKVKMMHYDITIKKKDNEGNINVVNELSILGIKGTSNKKDALLDLQLYLPSILLNYLSTFSLFNQRKDTYSFGFLEYSLSLPYRLFSQYLLIDEYLRDLIKAYNDNKSKFKDNVVIVGHSLGGGLSKIMGRFLGKQALSLSGPGVNAFQSLWQYEGSSENFEISAIDLVPDMDLVPRVEVSGGTIYRIICKEGPLDCHGKELSLCEVLIMCENPNYYQYCTKLAEISKYQIEAIQKSSEL